MEHPGPWSRAYTVPTINIIRWYPRWFPITASTYSDVDVCVLGHYYTYLDIWVGRVINVNIKNSNKRFYSCFIAYIRYLHHILISHVHAAQLLMLIFDLDISSQATWLSPEHLLGSFWLPWICMFRSRSVDWSGALHRRSSLPLGAGWLVPAPPYLTLPSSSRDFLSTREHLFLYML